jgi:hypothetical protein
MQIYDINGWMNDVRLELGLSSHYDREMPYPIPENHITIMRTLLN